MAIYRFKVSFEDYDEVNRIIEIKSTQTFLDFHHCIQESIKFDNKHAASFFVSDDFWRKNDEITLFSKTNLISLYYYTLFFNKIEITKNKKEKKII